jgi:hypothetical protein
MGRFLRSIVATDVLICDKGVGRLSILSDYDIFEE